MPRRVGVHYPGDIAAGAAIAGLAVFTVYVTDLGVSDVQQRTDRARLKASS